MNNRTSGLRLQLRGTVDDAAREPRVRVRSHHRLSQRQPYVQGLRPTTQHVFIVVKLQCNCYLLITRVDYSRMCLQNVVVITCADNVNANQEQNRPEKNLLILRRVQSTLSSKHIIFTNIVMSCDSYIATVWYIITSEYVRSKNMYYDFLAFLFQRADKYIQDNVARVRDIELLTGLQFLVSLPRGQAARLRTFLPEEIWKTDLVKAWHEMPCPQHDMCQSEWVLARVVWRWWTLEFVDFKLQCICNTTKVNNL